MDQAEEEKELFAIRQLATSRAREFIDSRSDKILRDHECLLEVFSYDDRSLSIETFSALEEILTEAIRFNIVGSDASVANDLFKPYGLLNSAKKKIDFCRVFGLIPKMIYDQFELFRLVRNEFAHKVAVRSFQDTRFDKHFKSIRKHRRSVQTVFDSYFAAKPAVDRRRAEGLYKSNRRFIYEMEFCHLHNYVFDCIVFAFAHQKYGVLYEDILTDHDSQPELAKKSKMLAARMLIASLDHAMR